MDVEQLQAFLTVVRSGGFRQGASKLHLSQPSLSYRIRSLEAELGVQLLDRSQRPVRLTEPGAALVTRAESILSAIDDAGRAVRDFDAHHCGTVSVGAMNYLAHLELPDFLVAFRERNPSVDLNLYLGTTGEITPLLLSGQIDVALVHAEGVSLSARFAKRRMRNERLVLITALDDPIATKPRLHWHEVSEAPFVTFRGGASISEALLTAASSAGFVPKVIV